MSESVTLDLKRLLQECRAAQVRMSSRNTHRRLLHDLELALTHLWQQRHHPLASIARAAARREPSHVPASGPRPD